MNLVEKRKRLAEIELLLESCTYDEYGDLAREYSILSDQIDADINLHSESVRAKELRRNAVHIVSPHIPQTKRGVSQ